MPQPTIPLEQARTNIDTTDQTGLMHTSTPELGAEGGPLAFGKAVNQVNRVNQVNQGGKNIKGKIGRNDPCWCGSGKKWKKCHYPQIG